MRIVEHTILACCFAFASYFPLVLVAQTDQIDIKAGYYQYSKVLPSDLKPAMTFQGKFQDGVRWKDESGENSVLLCYDNKAQGQRDIYVYQFREVGGKVNLVWDIRDFGGAACEMRFVDNSLQILDLDFDGVMEVGFMYANVCEAPGPQVTKLMLMRNGEKLAIRGKIDPLAHVESEKVVDVAATHPPIFKNFMLKQWKEYKEAEIEYTNYSLEKGENFLVLKREYMFASGGTAYELFDLRGLPARTVPTMEQKIQNAYSLDFTPDRKSLLYASILGVGIYDPVYKSESSFVTFLPETEAISNVAWSPDKKKIAFTALNFKEYPKETRIFVITMDGSTLVSKDKFDVPIFYMAASNWVVDPPRFIDNNTLEYNECITKRDERQPGPAQRIVLK